MNNNKIINVLDPTLAQDVSTKNYVDTNLTYNLSSAYSGQFSNINANLLILTCDGNNATYDYYNNVIKLLGGTVSQTLNGTGIYINIQTNIQNIGTSLSSRTGFTGLTPSGYNSNYDAVIVLNIGNVAFSDTTTILNSYYNNGKGVILHGFAVNGGSPFSLTLQKEITTYNTITPDTASTYIQDSKDVILYDVSSISPVYCSTLFTAKNGATGIGSIRGTNALNYLDDITGKGRRVDLNFMSINEKVILQALLWAGRKINNPTITQTKLNLNNPILPSLQVYNNLPSTNYDVINKLYLTNNIYSLYNNSKISKILTSSDYSIIFDLKKPYIFSLYYLNYDTVVGSNFQTLFIYPTYYQQKIVFKVLSGSNIQEGNCSIDASEVNAVICNISLATSGGKVIIRLRPNNSNYGLMCQEM